jgi:hypothetical protein
VIKGVEEEQKDLNRIEKKGEETLICIPKSSCNFQILNPSP